MAGLFSQTVEYGLRAMVWLASHDGGPYTADAIARDVDVSPGYLGKVLQSLCRAGLVHAQRGRNGGFEIAQPADKVTLLDVVNAVDPLQRIDRCPLGIKHTHSELCPLHKHLDEAIATVEQALGNITLAQVTPQNMPAICELTIKR